MKAVFPLRRLQAPQRIWADPQSCRRQPLREPGGGRPIAMAATLAAGTFAGMMLAPASGSAFPPAGSPVNAAEAAHTTAKTFRLPRASLVAPVRTGQGVMKAPGACTPMPASPIRPGPVAYV